MSPRTLDRDPSGHASAWPSLRHSVGQGAHNDPQEVRQVKNRFVELGFDWLEASPQGEASDFLHIIRLFQACTLGLQRVQGEGVDGRIDPGGRTHRWLQAPHAPQWVLLPLQGEGFFNHERQDSNDDHDYGTSWLREVIASAGRHYQQHWLRRHPGATLIQLNDASKPCGGDTPHHGGHETGMDVDIRVPREGGGAGGTWTQRGYDREAMRAQLQAFQAHPQVRLIFFNDDELIDEGLCRPMAGHDNHAHVHVDPPAL